MNFLLAFLMGGSLCIIAQLLIDLTNLTPARILVFFVMLGVGVYSVGLYDILFKTFGAGVSVPLLGFGANIARGVKEGVDKDGLFGILSGVLSSSSAGISFTLLLGLLSSFFFKSGPKRM